MLACDEVKLVMIVFGGWAYYVCLGCVGVDVGVFGFHNICQGLKIKQSNNT